MLNTAYCDVWKWTELVKVTSAIINPPICLAPQTTILGCAPPHVMGLSLKSLKPGLSIFQSTGVKHFINFNRHRIVVPILARDVCEKSVSYCMTRYSFYFLYNFLTITIGDLEGGKGASSDKSTLLLPRSPCMPAITNGATKAVCPPCLNDLCVTGCGRECSCNAYCPLIQGTGTLWPHSSLCALCSRPLWVINNPNVGQVARGQTEVVLSMLRGGENAWPADKVISLQF